MNDLIQNPADGKVGIQFSKEPSRPPFLQKLAVEERESGPLPETEMLSSMIVIAIMAIVSIYVDVNVIIQLPATVELA